MKLRVLGNVNLAPLARCFTRCTPTFAEYGAHAQELSDPASAAATGPAGEALLVWLDADILLGDALYGAGEAPDLERSLGALERFVADHPERTVVANTLCATSRRTLSYADVLAPGGVRDREGRANAALVALARKHLNLVLLDTELIVRRHGEAALVAPAFWYAGRIRYTQLMFREIALAVEQALAASRSEGRKVLVLDLDNTLWGGVLGEEGPEGVELSEDGKGKCYRDFQRALKGLQGAGVLLAVCSKNNPEDVAELFRRNRMMVLQPADFAGMKVSWADKARGLAELAEELQLGLSSFVFVDDSPVERAAVAQALPEVAVPEFPAQVERLTAWLNDEVVRRHFGRYRLTAEDLHKSAQYAANREREAASRGLSFDEFLQTLEIRLRFDADPAANVARASQLTQKTNQLNTTTRRYDVPAIQQLAASPSHEVVLVEYEDRFGREGIVGLAILDHQRGEIDALLLSCRVIGRRVEARLLEEIERRFRRRGAREAAAAFIPSAKNAPAARIYRDHGWELVETRSDGTERYRKVL